MAILLAVAVGGCGDAADEQALRDAFVDLRFAYFAGDYVTVCRSMSVTAKRQLGEMGHDPTDTCPDDLAERMSSAAPSRRDRSPAEVVAVEVDGGRATVSAELAGGAATTVRFVKDDGRWKLDRLFGATGPPLVDMR